MIANGDWMSFGSGASYGTGEPGMGCDGTKPVSVRWGMFAGKPVWRLS